MKFEMNRYTLGMLLGVEGLMIGNHSLTERKYSLLDLPVVINTDKPNGIVQLGRDTVDLSYTDNIRGSLESLLYASKRRKGGRVCFGPGGAYSVHSKETEELRVADIDQKKLDELRSAFDGNAKGSRGDLTAMSLYHTTSFKEWMKQNIGGLYTPSEEDIHELVEIIKSAQLQPVKLKLSSAYGSSERASGRTFRALLDVMKTASESPEGSLTLFVVLDGNEVYSSYGRLTHVMGRMLGNVLNDNKAKTLTFENRTIQVVSKNNMDFTNHSFGEGKRINVVYDHTVQGN